MNPKKDKRFTKILFSQKQIEKRIKELAKWVNKEYKNSKELVLVGLLKGSIPFLAQLIKDIDVEHSLDFIVASSYSGATTSSGNIKIIMDLASDIQNKDVLIVEDIIDSGITLDKVKTNLLSRKPKSLKIMTLLDKPARRKAAIKPDIIGFEVPDEFLAGFGLDVKEKMRNVPYIGIFNKDYLDKL